MHAARQRRLWRLTIALSTLLAAGPALAGVVATPLAATAAAAVIPATIRLPLSSGWNAGTPSAAGLPTLDQHGTGFPRAPGERVDAGTVESSLLLPATGQTVNLWVPVGGVILLLLGAGAILFARMRGRGGHRAR